MWKEFIESFEDNWSFRQPVSLKDILEVEVELGISFPNDLKNLLCESDGIEGEYGIELIWPLKKISEQNLYFRKSDIFKEIYMPFDCLLFFADAGNGDQFAYSIQDDLIRKDDIYVWNHEDDSRTWVAPSLKKFIQWGLEGIIKS